MSKRHGSKAHKPLQPSFNGFLAIAILSAFAPAGGALAQSSAERAFLAENDAAMNDLMTDPAIKPTGNVDKDSIDMMVPRHQGAVDMARAELRYGHNEQLWRGVAMQRRAGLHHADEYGRVG